MELNFCDHPDMFHLGTSRGNYMLSFIKEVALNYFRPLLMDPYSNPTLSDNYAKLVLELQTNFSLFNIKANAENELEQLKMHDNHFV